MGSWGLSTCVFVCMQGCHGFRRIAPLRACKYTCGQSPGTHALWALAQSHFGWIDWVIAWVSLILNGPKDYHTLRWFLGPVISHDSWVIAPNLVEYWLSVFFCGLFAHFKPVQADQVYFTMSDNSSVWSYLQSQSNQMVVVLGFGKAVLCCTLLIVTDISRTNLF